jgi:uncharacterized Zn-finger protein
MTREMTEDEKSQYVDEQVSAGKSCFCPWCGALNTADQNPCCKALQYCLDKRGEAQFESVRNQFQAVQVGAASAIDCPYCHRTTASPEPNEDGSERTPADWIRPFESPFCCDLLGLAISGILSCEHIQRKVDHAEMIAEAQAKAARN